MTKPAAVKSSGDKVIAKNIDITRYDSTSNIAIHWKKTPICLEKKIFAFPYFSILNLCSMGLSDFSNIAPVIQTTMISSAKLRIGKIVAVKIVKIINTREIACKIVFLVAESNKKPLIQSI